MIIILNSEEAINKDMLELRADIIIILDDIEEICIGLSRIINSCTFRMIIIIYHLTQYFTYDEIQM